MKPTLNHVRFSPDDGDMSALGEARACVSAAESLRRRASSLDPSSDRDRLAAIWSEYDRHVARATFLLNLLKSARPDRRDTTQPAKLALL